MKQALLCAFFVLVASCEAPPPALSEIQPIPGDCSFQSRDNVRCPVFIVPGPSPSPVTQNFDIRFTQVTALSRPLSSDTIDPAQIAGSANVLIPAADGAVGTDGFFPAYGINYLPSLDNGWCLDLAAEAFATGAGLRIQGELSAEISPETGTYVETPLQASSITDCELEN